MVLSCTLALQAVGGGAVVALCGWFGVLVARTVRLHANKRMLD